MKKYIDVLLVVPLEEEFEHVLECFGEPEDVSTETQVRLACQIGESGPTVLLVKQDKMGRTSTIDAVMAAVREYDFGILTCLGIAGGLSNDLAIGDVCHTGRIFDVLDNSKVAENDNGSQSTSLSPTIYEADTRVTTALARDRLAPDTKEAYKAWRTERLAAAKKLVPGEFRGKKGQIEEIVLPSVRVGDIACGQVSGSPAYNEAIKGTERKMLAIETESGGLFWLAKQSGRAALTVRGISDYAGVDKNKFEEETNNQARSIAALNAATYLAGVLRRPKMQAFLQTARDECDENQPSLIATHTADPIVDAIHMQGEEIDTRLRELSPSYSLLDKGYRLPVPRVKLMSDGSGAPSEGSLEIRDALMTHRSILLNLPKEYPDLSLPWVIAKDLLSSEIGDKQVIPCVVEGKQLRVPRQGVMERSPPAISEAYATKEALVVFIINEFDFVSKTKSDFLIEQISKYHDASFVILSKGKAAQVSESNFVKHSGSTQGAILDVSFSEIAFFLQKNFSLDGAASEVVAKRLRETFDSFNLPAHPSFFAGIPRDTLMALLQANRRAELIQLAVAGYLSWVVAEDNEPITLSRTTRESFLGELASELRLAKRTFTQAEIVTHAAEVAEKYHFRISAANFIAAFYDRGILHDDDGHVAFTLPFMEAYLLARKLKANEAEAKRYFSIIDEDFDYTTFSLYAELGAADDIVQWLSSIVDDTISELAARYTDPILLQDTINPAIMRRQDRIQMLRKRLEKAADDIRNDRGNLAEKQRLLDASEKIRENAAERTDLAKQADEEGLSVEQRAVMTWYSAVVLLGSGAEQLFGETKSQLISKVVTLGSMIINCWTADAHSVDFEKLRVDMLADDELIKEVIGSDSSERADAERMIEGLVDLLEYSIISEPFSRITGTLCEEARHAVLGESISRCEFTTDFDRLLGAIWMADVDPPSGKKKLTEAVKALPNAVFLRVIVSTHLQARAYWKHWQPEHRLALVEAADDALKGIGMTNNNVELRRDLVKEIRAAKETGKK